MLAAIFIVCYAEMVGSEVRNKLKIGKLALENNKLF